MLRNDHLDALAKRPPDTVIPALRALSDDERATILARSTSLTALWEVHA